MTLYIAMNVNKPWYEPKMPFGEAYNNWKSGGRRGIAGMETITFGSLVVIGIQSLISTSVGFFTWKSLAHLWEKIFGKKEKE